MYCIRSSMIFAVLCLAIVCGAAPAQDEATGAEPPAPCSAGEYRQFDFWVGEWTVKNPGGDVVGHNTIERVLGGCALHESWQGAKGSVGHSYNSYDATRDVWHQTWVDGRGMLLLLEGGMDEGSMVLEGKTHGSDGSTVHNRISWTPKDDGTVRQHWEQSKDGEAWRTVFDGLYVPDGGD